MSDTPQVLLQQHLKKLRLPTFHSEYGKLARQCAAENKDHIQYLLRLCELELIERERRLIERRIKSAKFPAAKSLDSFDFQVIPSLNKVLAMQLARSEFVDQRQNVIALGPSGASKTHIDELGFVPLSKTVADLLFDVISQRHKRRSIIITSNLQFDEWTEFFGSERLTGANLGRLTHHVHILEMNGESFRLRQSRNRS
jgi:DNA replication protein DnaC